MKSGSMVKRLSSVFLLLVFASIAFAGAVDRPINVRIEGSGANYWVCLITQDPNDATGSFTSVRELINKASGKWSQIAQLQAKVIDVAAVDDRLAVLTSTGDWQLIWRGGNVIGSPLPDGRIATRLAGTDDMLLAVTRAATGDLHPTLYRWTQKDGWSRLADLPPGATTDSASIAFYDGRPWIAYLAKDAVRVAEFDGKQWNAICSVSNSKTFELISGAPKAMLAWHGSGGRISVYDVHTTRPLVVQSLEVPEPNDAAVVDTSLRFVTTDGTTITQTAFDQYGRGAQTGPDQIAKLDLSPQREREWMNVVVVGLLTIAMLATFRQRPPNAQERLETSKLLIAPLSRRIPAGVIDAIPFLIGGAWVVNRVSNASLSIDDVTTMIYVPQLIGMAVYILHVTISELIFGRSIGKLIFGLRVVTTEGGPVPAGRIILRNLLRVLDLLLFLPIFFVFISPNSQRIGDLAARTLVVTDDSLEAVPLDEADPT